MTHICVGKLTIIDSDNGLSPKGRQAIIWTNAGILLIGPLGTNSSQIVIGIQTFSFKKMHLKVSSAKRRLFCLGLNVLTDTKRAISTSSHMLHICHRDNSGGCLKLADFVGCGLLYWIWLFPSEIWMSNSKEKTLSLKKIDIFIL